MILSLREQILRDEGGYQSFVYTDSTGHETIGVGRNVSKTGRGLSLYEQDLMLNNDILDFTIEVLRALPWAYSLDMIRFEVLVNMAFNLGIEGLLGFPKFLAALQAHQYANPASEMPSIKSAIQVPPRPT